MTGHLSAGGPAGSGGRRRIPLSHPGIGLLANGVPVHSRAMLAKRSEHPVEALEGTPAARTKGSLPRP